MGLKRLISRLDSGESFGSSFPNHNTPDTVGGFNYGESISIFDVNQTNNDFFPFQQRSLGYGPQGTKDTTGIFGRVHGPAPYRRQNLPDLNPDKLGPGDTGPILGIGGAVDAVTDVGVRGGLVTALERSFVDSLRIGEFLLSAKGLGFIAKNVGLQATNPKLQEGDTGLFGLGRNRVYNLGINTVAQTLANFSGLHITRQGALPVGPNNYKVEQGYRIDSNNETKYEYNVRGSTGTGNNGIGGQFGEGTDVYKDNRLVALYNRLLKRGALGLDANDELYEFRGGPHSIYGIGRTRLKRYVNTNYESNRAKLNSLQEEGYKKSRHLGIRDGIAPATNNTPVIDFRKFRGVPYTNYDQKIGDTGTNLQQKYGYARHQARTNLPKNEDGSLNVRASNPFTDRINSTDIWTHEGPWDTTDLGSKVKDYIKFRIEAVNTDNPRESNTMVFRAFLDSMDDNYSSKWNEYNYNGRAEPFYTFGSFNRAISFSFKVAAFSRDDMRPMYRKLNYLVSQTAGEYRQTRLRGNFCRLTIGDYHNRLPGFFTGISLKWNKEYPWEIAMFQNGVGTEAKMPAKNHSSNPTKQLIVGREEELLQAADDRESRAILTELNGGKPLPEDDILIGTTPASAVGGIQEMDSDMLELPHVLDVSCNFQPVHDFIPQKSTKNSPFILPVKYNRPGLDIPNDWLNIPGFDTIKEEDRQRSIKEAEEEAAKQQQEAEAAAAEEERLRKLEEERLRKLAEEEANRPTVPAPGDELGPPVDIDTNPSWNWSPPGGSDIPTNPFT